MALITSNLPILPPSKLNREIEDRDCRKLPYSKLKTIVSHTLVPSRQLWHSENRIKIIAEQILINQKSSNPDRTPESLLGLIYISAHLVSLQQNYTIDANLICNSCGHLLYNLEIKHRAVVYKVLPLMEGEFGRKMRFAAAPILYHIPPPPIYTWDENHFKYSVGETLREGLELSRNLLCRNKEEFDFLCEKIAPLVHHSSEERKLCVETWNKSLEARLTLLEQNHYEIGLPRYELIDYYNQDVSTGAFGSYHSTRIFNLFGNTRPEQKPDYDILRGNLNPYTRNPAWIFSTTIEGLNVNCTSDASGFPIEELRIESPIIKMTEDRVPRPTFTLLCTLHDPSLDEGAVNALKQIEDNYQDLEAFQLSYSAFRLELEFLKGRVTNFRPFHWPATGEPPVMEIMIPNWTTLATKLEKFNTLLTFNVLDVPENDCNQNTEQQLENPLFDGSFPSYTPMTEEEIGNLLFPENNTNSDNTNHHNYFLSQDFY